MARLTEHGLRRSVGVPGLFATAYGNVGSSIYYALGLVAAHALGLTPLVFMFAGGLFVLTAKTYAEGAAMFPEAGSSSFARHAFDDVVSFFAGWALSLDYIITIAISAFFVPHYLGAFFPSLTHNPGDIIGGLITIVLLGALNIRGLGESAKLNLFLAVADLCTQVLLVGVGVVLVLNPALLVNQVHLGIAPSWTQLIFALSVAMVAYTGIETVSNMAEEAKDPGHDIPKSVNLVVIAVLGVYAGISIVALSALPVVHHAAIAHHAAYYATELGTTFENDPVLGIVSRLGLHGTTLALARDYVGVLAATILFIATNAGLIGISRLSWSLAEHRQLPSLFSRLAPTFRTPWFTIVFFSILAGTADPARRNDAARQPLLVRRDAVVHDRARRGGRAALQRPRPRAPLPDAVERAHPRAPDPDDGGARSDRHVRRLVRGRCPARRGAHDRDPWMLVGMVGYLVYRKRQGLDPRKHYRIERPERPPDFAELDYRTALVPIFGADVSATALGSAAADRRGGRGLRDLRPARAQPALAGGGPGGRGGPGPLGAGERAHPGAAAGIKIHTGLIRTRNPGAALVEEARTGGVGRHLLVGDPCACRRAADRADRGIPAEQAPVPGDHRDREPPRAAARGQRGRR